MTVRDFMAGVDACIFKSPIVRAVAAFGDTSEVEGAFFLEPRELAMPGGNLRMIGVSFECQWLAEIAELVTGDPFFVDGTEYRFRNEVIPGGDESGLTIIELGEKM